MEKIKLVVVNENTLGYINPKTPNLLGVLHSSILKGAPFILYPGPRSIFETDKVRLASEADFEEYRVCFNGYKNNPDEYEFSLN